MDNRQVNSFVRRNRAFFVGLFVIIPAVVLPGLIIYSLLKADFMQGWCYLHVVYQNSYGLTKGSQITISGMQIGHVKEISLEKENVVNVAMKVRDQYQPLIRKDTRAQLKQKSFVVGDWCIELTGGSLEALVVNDGDTLVSEFPVQIDKAVAQIAGMITTVEQTLQTVLSGKGTVGRLITEDTLLNTLQDLGRKANSLAGQAGVTVSKTNGLIDDISSLAGQGGQFIDSLQQIIQNVAIALEKADGVLKDLQGVSGQLPETMVQVRDDLWEAENMLKSVQKSWILKRLSNKGEDPLLDQNP
ncbi:MAG: MCE family protein [Fibrobacter sp.]|nr:MCE family protein [Fibrobacter sp.]